MKTCSKCKEPKLESDFFKRASVPSGLSYQCKDCHHSKRRGTPKPLWRRKVYLTEEERQEGARISRRKGHFKLRYGITLEELDRMKEDQGGLCAIVGCRNDAEVVDHCHTTGKVRGLLCHRCNKAIGFLEEDTGKTMGVLRYLRIHKESKE